MKKRDHFSVADAGIPENSSELCWIKESHVFQKKNISSSRMTP